MKSKQTNKKAKAESTNLGPPGTPDNLKSTSTPNPSPSGSTSSTGSSHQGAGSSTYVVSIRPGPPDQSGGVANPGGSSSGAGGITGKSTNAKSKGAGASKDTTDKGVTSVTLQKSAHTALGAVTQFDLGSFPKINGLLGGNKPGAAAGQANLASAAVATPPVVAAGAVGLPDVNKSLENLSMDDVDMLQTELETLWSSVAVRIRNINQEIGGLQTAPGSSHHHNLGLEHFDPQHQEKIAAVATIIDHGTRTSVSAAAKLVMGSQLASNASPLPSPSTSAAVAATPSTKKATTAKGERQPKKKLKGEGSGIGKSSKKGGDKPAARATQNRSHSVSSDVGSDGVVKQHEVPNQFWDSVDPYFRDITAKDLDNLQNHIDQHNDFPEELMEIPPLGKHYKDDEETAKKKAKEHQASSGKDQVGELTQRLVSALTNERVAMHKRNQVKSPNEDASTGASSAGSGTPEGGFIHRQGLARALGLDGSGPSSAKPNSNSSPLESRIRDCLLENGILSAEDAHNSHLMNPDDEVLAEIKRTQSTLKRLHRYNSDVFQRFMAIGRREMERQKYKQELEKADREVIEAYKVITQLRLKKKPVTKKEKDAAFKALEARKDALMKLEAQEKKMFGPNYRSGGGPSTSSAAATTSDPTAALRVQV